MGTLGGPPVRNVLKLVTGLMTHVESPQVRNRRDAMEQGNLEFLHEPVRRTRRSSICWRPSGQHFCRPTSKDTRVWLNRQCHG